MPFRTTLYPFNRPTIESLAPNTSGVYGLYHDYWVYVDKGNIRDRLLAHLNGDNSCITGQKPTYWVAEIIAGDPSSREKELILELGPICDKKIG